MIISIIRRIIAYKLYIKPTFDLTVRCQHCSFYFIIRDKKSKLKKCICHFYFTILNKTQLYMNNI